MKKVLVTGGSGYIGSHTVVELIRLGYEALIIDNLSNSDIAVVDRIEQICGRRPSFSKVEMCDRKALEAFFDAHPGIDAVIHFAARLFVDESVEKPLYYYENNLLSTINLLSCMEKHKIEALVFSSSCTVYGQPDKLPVTETAAVKPAMSPYGNTKKICEDIISDFSKVTAMQAISLRYFNPIGAHESALIGELPHGVPAHLVPYITETAIGKREHLRVFGDDYNTRDGSCIRDYVHVSDVANAHIKAIERIVHGKTEQKHEVFNLGSGKGFSVLEMVKSFEKATGLRIRYEIYPRRKGDVEAVYADNQLAKQKLGWVPKYSLDDMLLSAWNWQKKLNENPTFGHP